MDFYAVLAQVMELLQREGRVSYRALTRQFDLDNDYLEDLKAEIIKAKRLAVDEDGDVLVWTGGTALPAASGPATDPERAPRSYTPAHLTEKILQARPSLEGERKQVTVLFADLKGSMELLADRDPEEARQLLDPVLQRMMDAVHRFEGTVNQVMGDGIMALFGAPLAHEDHAVRACYAALRMQAAMRAYTEEVRRAHGLEMRIRVGLNSGAVVVRSIGNDLHMDYTAVGQTTHLAARLEQLARPGSTLLTGETLRLVEGYVEVTPLGPVPVKGLPEPIEVYELTGAGPRRSRFHAVAARGLTRFVGRAGELDQLRQPLLVVFEDLHWIDFETQALLDGLVESLPAARLLLLVNYRPEYQHPWGSRTAYTQLRLDPLPPERAEQLLGALLGPDAGLEPLTRVLITRTEGNPFFLEESVRALVETGSMLGERGAYRLARPLPAIQVPATVQAVLAARIDRLPLGDKALLQTASVVGKDVPFVLLQAIAEPADDELHAAIGRLQAAEFLYETSLYPEREYTFKHALTHEVTYGSLLQDRRRTLHGQIVETIERRYPDRLPEHLERLAHHAFRGDLWGKAVTYLRQAGAKAAARSAYREAVGYFEQALTALTHLPESRETWEQAIDLRFDLRNALFPLAEFGRIEGYLRDAESLARRLGDQRRLGWVSAYMSSHYLVTGGYTTQVHTFAQRVEAIGETLSDVPLQVAAQYNLALACYISGDYRGTERACRSLMQSLQGERTRERFGNAVFPAVLSRAHLARALAERGVFDEGDAVGQEAIRMAEAVDHPYSLMAARLGLAYANSVRGELSQAARLLERAVALCREWNITIWIPLATASLGHVYARSGRLEEGISWLQQGLTAFESAGIGLFQSLSVVQLGEAYLLADQVEDARACAERAVRLARERGERGYEAWALRLLGEIASHQSGPDVATAEAHYGAAMALASELGMRPLAAHCHLGLGTLHTKIGRLEQARAELSTAIDLYRAMEMTFWLPEAEAALAQVEGR